MGLIRVSITQDGLRPAPGKRIELVGTLQSATTDKMGLAQFYMPAGHYVVRAYDIGTPGPGLAFVDRNADVRAGQATQVEYFDCTMCRAPQP